MSLNTCIARVGVERISFLYCYLLYVPCFPFVIAVLILGIFHLLGFCSSRKSKKIRKNEDELLIAQNTDSDSLTIPLLKEDGKKNTNEEEEDSRDNGSPFTTKSRTLCWCLQILSFVQTGFQVTLFLRGVFSAPVHQLVDLGFFTIAWAATYPLQTLEYRSKAEQLSAPVLLVYICAIISSWYQFLLSSTFWVKNPLFWNASLVTAAIALIFVTCGRETKVSVHRNKPPPENTAGLWSFLTLCWYNDIIAKGTTKQLNIEDLPTASNEESAFAIYNRFEESSGKGTSVLWRLVKVFGLMVLPCAICQLAADLATLCLPLALKNITDYVSAVNTGEQIPGLHNVPTIVIVSGIAMFAGSLADAIANNIQVVAFQSLSRRVHCCLCTLIYSKMLRTDMSTVSFSIGEITNLMSSDVGTIRDCMLIINDMWLVPIKIVFCVALLFNLLGWSAVAGLTVIILAFPITKYTTYLMRKIRRKTMRAKDDRISTINEVLMGIRVIKLFAWEEEFLSKIREKRSKEMKLKWKAKLIGSSIGLQYNSLTTLVGLATLLTHTQILGKPLTMGQGFAAIALFGQLKDPLMSFPDNITKVVNAMVSMERIQNFLNTKEVEKPSSTTTDQDSWQGHRKVGSISVKGGTFRWGSAASPQHPSGSHQRGRGRAGRGGRQRRNRRHSGSINSTPAPACSISDALKPTLQNLSIEVEPGSLVCIYGPTGCGKSSILMAILGEITKVHGSTHHSGSVAYASQKAWIQNKKLRDNILFGLPFDAQKYNETIEVCALRRDLELLEGGDLTEIGEKGINLSGGQQQRVSLARAVYADADIYLLDDVLSAVDAHVGKHIFESCIKGTLGGKTRILITHQIQMTIKDADHIIVLDDDGSVIDQGPPSKLQGSASEMLNLIKDIQSRSEDDNEAEPDPEPQTTSKKPMQKEIQGSSGTRLVEKEKRKKGAQGAKTYWAYFAACGGILFAIFIILAHTLRQVFAYGANWTLTIWIDQIGKGKSSSFGMWLYVGSSILNIASLLFNILVRVLGSFKASVEIHENMITRVIRCPCSWFEKTPLGRIVNRFSSDMRDIDNILMPVLNRSLATVLGVINVCLVISIGLPWLILGLVPLLSYGTYVASLWLPSARETKRLMSVSRSPIYAHFSESIVGVSTIRAFSLQQRFFLDSCRQMDIFWVAAWSRMISRAWINFRLACCGVVMTGLVSWVLILDAENMSAATASLLLTYVMTLASRMSGLVQNISNLEVEMNSVQRAVEYMELDQESPPSIPGKEPSPSWPQNGELKVTDLSLKYPSSSTIVLKNLNFTIEARTRVGIVGRTGAGKSSFTSVLFRLVEPLSGKIEIDGINIFDIGLKDLRPKLSIVPQDPLLFCGSLRSNIDPFERYQDSNIWDALDRVKLRDTVSALPTGLMTEVKEGGSNFSVGQRQLICMARAILSKSAILVMDEATANVDPLSDEIIQNTVKNYFNDCTVICIAHRLDTIIFYDKVMFLDQGNLIEYDSPSVLLGDPSSAFYTLCATNGNLEHLQRLAFNATSAM